MSSSKSQLKAGIILNYLNMIVGNLIPVFYTPVMLQLLGQSSYGLYKLSATVTSYLTLMSLGLGAAITRYLIKARTEGTEKDEERVLGLFTVIFQVVAAATLVVGTILAFNLHRWYGDSLTTGELAQMKVLVLILVLNTALSFSQTPYLSEVNAHERFVFQQCMNILTTCLGPALNLVALWLGFGSVGMACTSLIITLLCRVCYTIYVRRTLQIRPIYANMPTGMLKEILTFSFWIFVGNVVSQLNNATDTIMIGMIPALATVGVAVYNVGGVFNSIVLSLTTGISTLLAPKTNKMVFSAATGQELTEFSARVGRIQGYIMCLVVSGFIAFGQPFIHFYVGPAYADAYWVALFMMVPSIVPLVQSACLSIVVAQNKHRFRSIVYLIIAILNATSTWFVLPYWGIVGAALMTGIAGIIGTGFMMNWYYHKRTGLNMIFFWKKLSSIYIIPAAMCVGTLFLSRIVDFYKIPVLVLGIIVYTIVYGVLNWLFIMNDEEKQLITGPLAKVLRRK